VPSKQRSDFRGKRTYPLSSKKTPLNYQTEVSSCGPEDIDFVAFVEATSLIGDRDAVEEFLACGLWPLGEQIGFKVDMKESPLSKVVVPMPRITTTIGEWESGDSFVAHIEDATNELGGRYTVAGHIAYQGLRHGRLNCIFELAGVLIQPHPEPIVWKSKFATTVTAPAPRRTSGK
jgi:hypothetical protein